MKFKFKNWSSNSVNSRRELARVLSSILEAVLYSGFSPCAAVPAEAALEKRCEYCDGTGLVHGADGELRGICTQCNTSKQILES